MTTRVLDLRPYIPDFNGPLGWVVKKLGFWSPQPIEAASEVTRRELPIDPEPAAREFVVRDEPLPTGRLDLVVAYVGSEDEKFPDVGQLRTLGEQILALRTDGTLGLLCVTTDENSQSVADLGGGPFDFVIRLGTTATEVIPELVEVL